MVFFFFCSQCCTNAMVVCEEAGHRSTHRASRCCQWRSDSSVVHSQPVAEIRTPYILPERRLFVCWGSTVWGTGLFFSVRTAAAPVRKNIIFLHDHTEEDWLVRCLWVDVCSHTVEIDLMFVSDGSCSHILHFGVSIQVLRQVKTRRCAPAVSVRVQCQVF